MTVCDSLHREAETPPSRSFKVLSIGPDEVHAGVERELCALAGLGRSGSDALRDAVAIVAGKIRNSPVLIERQPANGCCHVCRTPLDDSRPEVSVMQGKPGSPLHMHADCHAEHRRRRAALVDRIMAAAGFGQILKGNNP